MSVDKAIEELSYTLAQLGTLVGHINSQIGQLAARINLTLDTFDQSVAAIALDADVMSNRIAHTISQVPNGWLFYLFFLTIIVVFLLLSIILIMSTIIKCHGVYKLIKKPTNSKYGRFEGDQYGFGSKDTFASHHISIPMDMEKEPRRIGLVSNGDLKKRRSPTSKFRYSYQPERSSSFNNGQYRNVQRHISKVCSNGSAQV